MNQRKSILFIVLTIRYHLQRCSSLNIYIVGSYHPYSSWSSGQQRSFDRKTGICVISIAKNDMNWVAYQLGWTVPSWTSSEPAWHMHWQRPQPQANGHSIS